MRPSLANRPRGRTIGLVAGVTAVTVLLLLALAQLLLPWIASQRISSRVGRYGHVDSVSVSAWPAVELLWGNADEVEVRAASLALSTSQAAKLLREAHGVSRLRVTADAVKIGSLQLTDATLRKRGSSLVASARASRAAVSAALPPGLTVKLLGSRAGEVEVLAGGGLFGISASVRARAYAQGGALVARPIGFLLEGFSLTLFDDPHIAVVGVGASEDPTQPPGYRLTMTARLR